MKLMTGEWYPNRDPYKPWIDREVLVRCRNGSHRVAHWTGQRWVANSGKYCSRTLDDVTHFMIFERCIPEQQFK